MDGRNIQGFRIFVSWTGWAKSDNWTTSISQQCWRWYKTLTALAINVIVRDLLALWYDALLHEDARWKWREMCELDFWKTNHSIDTHTHTGSIVMEMHQNRPLLSAICEFEHLSSHFPLQRSTKKDKHKKRSPQIWLNPRIMHFNAHWYYHAVKWQVSILPSITYQVHATGFLPLQPPPWQMSNDCSILNHSNSVSVEFICKLPDTFKGFPNCCYPHHSVLVIASDWCNNLPETLPSPFTYSTRILTLFQAYPSYNCS